MFTVYAWVWLAGSQTGNGRWRAVGCFRSMPVARGVAAAGAYLNRVPMIVDDPAGNECGRFTGER